MTEPEQTHAEKPLARESRVLVAEDDSEIRRTLAAALREQGYLVAEACDGEELLDLITASVTGEWNALPFDAIVSDLWMPGFTALDVLTALRRRLARTPVILITAQKGHGVETRCLRAGAYAVLHKPFDLSELSALLRRATHHARPGIPPHLS